MTHQDSIIEWDGDTWRIIGRGATKRTADGEVLVFVHLASTTRSLQQRNGRCPIQICDWVPVTATETT